MFTERKAAPGPYQGSDTCGAPTSSGVPGCGRFLGLLLHTSTVSWVSKNSSGSSGVRGVWTLEPASELLSRSSSSTGSELGRLQKGSIRRLSSARGEQGALRSASSAGLQSGRPGLSTGRSLGLSGRGG